MINKYAPYINGTVVIWFIGGILALLLKEYHVAFLHFVIILYELVDNYKDKYIKQLVMINQDPKLRQTVQ